jgi:hypothetical protein
MDKNSAFFYRRGLGKEDFKKNTLTLSIKNTQNAAPKTSGEPASIAALINSDVTEQGEQF